MIQIRERTLTKAKWSPLESAKWFMDELSKETDKCNATGMAARSAGAFGNLEAAFYTNEIDEDTMEGIKGDVMRLIDQFNKKCECRHKT